ncbi:MAG: DUF502 domain-containing protein [Gemmatimonadaceae bacterium]|jgi:uncharacterized membrane protein|nr:DUF502 domain-containing protein [Gemmatimonadaceae bacterium]
MRRLVGYFVRGVLVVAPLAVTVYICWKIFEAIDGWLNLPYPGAGFALTILLITVVGAVAGNLVTRTVVRFFDGLLSRVPFVRLLYSATKDLLDAFVGEKRRFDRPALVHVVPGSGVAALGFITQESAEAIGLADHVAVYLPHSYNWSGQLLVVPRAQIEPIDGEPSEVMAFIVSSGVTGRLDRDAGDVRGRTTPRVLPGA